MSLQCTTRTPCKMRQVGLDGGAAGWRCSAGLPSFLRPPPSDRHGIASVAVLEAGRGGTGRDGRTVCGGRGAARRAAAGSWRALVAAAGVWRALLRCRWLRCAPHRRSRSLRLSSFGSQFSSCGTPCRSPCCRALGRPPRRVLCDRLATKRRSSSAECKFSECGSVSTIYLPERIQYVQ